MIVMKHEIEFTKNDGGKIQKINSTLVVDIFKIKCTCESCYKMKRKYYQLLKRNYERIPNI